MATLLSTSTMRERSHGLLLVEPSTDETVSPVSRRRPHHMLVVEPNLLVSQESTRIFRAANYAMHSVRTWHQAIEWVERADPEVVLLDIDAIDSACSSVNVSAARLVTLLHHAINRRPIIIAGVSHRDFFEIEYVLRAGISIFVERRTSLINLVYRIDAARRRTDTHEPIQELAG